MLKTAICGWSARGGNRHITKTLLAMKLTFVLLTAGFLNISAKGISQNVTFSGEKVPLKTVFQSVEKQTGFLFLSPESVLRASKPVSLNVRDLPLDRFLALVFKFQPLQYDIRGKSIFVSLKPAIEQKLSDIDLLQDTLIDVKGTVTDAEGKAIPGATIIVKGSDKGASTDANGNFSLPNVRKNSTLSISSIGYKGHEVIIRKSNITIILQVSTSKLDEVQIQAYGTTSRRFNVGNISSVRSGDIEKAPVTNVLSAVQGRVPGVVISQVSGIPGAGFTVQIRGRNSLNNMGAPFYVIDGVPFSSEIPAGIFGPGVGNGNPLNFLNPADIESIDILKDADATAIYGSRAANGVVLITTKKAKAGKLRADAAVQSGVGKVARKLDLLNTQQYLSLRREAFANDGELAFLDDPSFNQFYPDLKVWDTTRYTDWQDVLLGGTANFTNATASLSGGSGNTQFLVGAGYNRTTTVFPQSGADTKGSLHVNITSRSADSRFLLTFNTSFLSDNNRLPNVDFTPQVFLAPDAPVLYNADGSLNWAPYNTSKATWDNPYAVLSRKYSSQTNNIVSSMQLSYELARGLTFRLPLGFTYTSQNMLGTVPARSINPNFNQTTSISGCGFTTVSSWNVEPQLNYTRTLGEGVLDALVGTTIQQNNQHMQSLQGLGYTNEAFLEDLNASATIVPNGSVHSQYKYNSLFGRLNYRYAGKYIVNLTARRDGSNRFGPGHRFGNFGSVGAGWIFSTERFMQHAAPIITYGKLRASYGTTGSDQIPDFQYLSTYSPFGTTYNTLPYQGVTGLGPDNLSNPIYHWETTKKAEAGLELGFFRDWLLISASYYQNRSSNQLINYTLPSFVGFSTVLGNFPATVQNNGWEFTASAKLVQNNAFSWTVNANATLARNKLLEFPDLETSSYANDFVIGQPINLVRAYRFAGLDPASGTNLFYTAKGEKVSDPGFGPENKIVSVNTAPKWYGGLSNTFTFKGFVLDFLLQYVRQRGRNFYFVNNQYPGYLTNQQTLVLDRWQKAGDDALLQRFSQNYSLNSSNAFLEASDFVYGDASFLRLKNMSLSYTLPQRLVGAMHLSGLRLFALGQNLLTITSYKGFDPETQSMVALPPLRVITFGIQAGL